MRLVRQVAFPPRAILPEPRSPRLRDDRPVQEHHEFAVGAGEVLAGIPEELCQRAPLHPVVYLGRVEEVAETGEITARVWECPGGQESIATLSPEDLDQEAHPGAALRIWTWLELPDDSQQSEPVPRMHVAVRNRSLSEIDQMEIYDCLMNYRKG